MVSEEIWQQRLQRFYTIANPERDMIGLPVRRTKTAENKAAVEFYKNSTANDKNFVLKMVKRLFLNESTHTGHKTPFDNVRNIFEKITLATFHQHKEAIGALLVRLDRQLELEWYAAHPKTTKFGPSFRWSFRHIMMKRCQAHDAMQVEYWMHGQELLLSTYTGASELDALRAYVAQR